MNTIVDENPTPLNHAVERLVAEHGLLSVTAALMRRLFRRYQAAGRPVVGDLPDHLRRDIGLAPGGANDLAAPMIPFPPKW